MSLSKETTEAWLNASELLILLCGLVLAFGAAGEYLEDHEKLPRWMAWSRKPKLVFVWMVAISLVGEFVGDAGVFMFSGHLQTIADGEYAALNKEAADARRDAGKANKEAGLARKEASDANEDAGDTKERTAQLSVDLEKERQKTAQFQRSADVARLALSKQLEAVAKQQQPRRLDFALFSASLKSKPTSSAELLYKPDDDEAYQFAQQISMALLGAGWGPQPMLPKPIPQDIVTSIFQIAPGFVSTLPVTMRAGGGSLGMSFVTNKSGTPTPAKDAVAPVFFSGSASTDALMNAFMACGYGVNWSLDDQLPENFVRVLIGAKN